VQVVQVDVLRPQPRQRRLAEAADELGPAVDPRAVLAAHDAELTGEHDLITPPGDGAADELLVVTRP
jgi:hypothetical protein